MNIIKLIIIMPFSKDPTHMNIIPRELFVLPHNRICSDQWGSRIFQMLW